MGISLEDADYVLPPELERVWITVDNISVHVKRNDEGVSVTLYPTGQEDSGESLTETWATFAEAGAQQSSEREDEPIEDDDENAP